LFIRARPDGRTTAERSIMSRTRHNNDARRPNNITIIFSKLTRRTFPVRFPFCIISIARARVVSVFGMYNTHIHVQYTYMARVSCVAQQFLYFFLLLILLFVRVRRVAIRARRFTIVIVIVDWYGRTATKTDGRSRFSWTHDFDREPDAVDKQWSPVKNRMFSGSYQDFIVFPVDSIDSLWLQIMIRVNVWRGGYLKTSNSEHNTTVKFSLVAFYCSLELIFIGISENTIYGITKACFLLPFLYLIGAIWHSKEFRQINVSARGTIRDYYTTQSKLNGNSITGVRCWHLCFLYII